jgi:hypothetical protein
VVGDEDAEPPGRLPESDLAADQGGDDLVLVAQPGVGHRQPGVQVFALPSAVLERRDPGGRFAARPALRGAEDADDQEGGTRRGERDPN